MTHQTVPPYGPLFVVWFGGIMAYARHRSPAGASELFVAGAIGLALALLNGLCSSAAPEQDDGRVRENPRSPISPYAFVLFPLMIAAVPGLWPGVVILAAGAVLTWLVSLRALRGYGRLRHGARAALSVGVMAFLAACLYRLYDRLEPYLQDLSLPAPLTVWAARLMGFSASHVGNALWIAHGGTGTYYGTSPRHAELFPVLLAWFLVCFALVREKRRWTGLALLVGAATVAILVYRELIILGAAILTLEEGEALDLCNYVLLYGFSYFPFFVVAAAVGLIPVAGRRGAREGDPLLRRPLGLGVALILAVAGGLLGYGLAAESSGAKKEGRVAIDDYHSTWEWTDVPIDQENFGTQSTYSFRALVVLLRQFFPRVDTVGEGPLDLSLLRQYDVWILKCPTKPYGPEEVKAIHTYVREGGGLWLIGDHTNIFGMNSYLNQISAAFGFTFRSDAVCAYVPRRARHLWRRDGEEHPIVRDIPELLFLTSCTLAADPVRARPVIVGRGQWADAADYAVNTFFGDLKRDPREPYGRFLQSLSVEYGQGRVVAFTDSTVLSSFGVHYPGRYELTVNSVAWLNSKTGSRLATAFVFAAAGLLFAVGLIFVATRCRMAGARDVGFWLLLGFLVSLSGVRIAQAEAGGIRPEPHWTVPRAAFLATDPLALPYRSAVSHDEISPRVFDTFFVWFLRADVLPFVEESPGKAADYDYVVILDPRGSLKVPAAITALEELMGRGRGVWILTANRLVAETILDRAFPKQPRLVSSMAGGEGESVEAVDTVTGERLSIPRPRYLIHGINPLLELDQTGTVIGWFDWAGGRVVLCSCPAMFSNAAMGSPTEIATKERYQLYKVQWECIRRLAKKDR